MIVDDVMTRNCITIAPDATVEQAVNLMLNRHISGLFVVDKAGELAGDHRRGRPVGASGEHPGCAGRRVLERVVRACATAAADEPDFVARLRGEGVLARPRYADGSTR